MTVSGGKTVLEELEQVDLAAGLGEKVEILVVDVDVAAVVRVGNVLVKNVVVNKVLRAFGTVFEHGPHCRVGVDVGILALDVGILCVNKGQGLENVHEILLCLAQLAAFGAVEYVCLGRFGEIVGNQHFLHNILYLLDRRNGVRRNFIQHLIGEGKHFFFGNFLVGNGVSGLSDSVAYLGGVEFNGLTAPLYNKLGTFRQNDQLL